MNDSVRNAISALVLAFVVVAGIALIISSIMWAYFSGPILGSIVLAIWLFAALSALLFISFEEGW